MADFRYVIVSNSYKRPLELIEKNIRSSLGQKPEAKEIIFIDQNSPALEFPQDIKENPRFNHFKSLVPSVSEARNSFEIPSDIDWVIFCDDDGYLCSDYVQRLLHILQKNTDLKVLAGSIVRTDNEEFYTLRHKVGGSLKLFRNSKLLMGSNFVVHRETYLKLKKFDSFFGAGAFWGAGEETDFAWKAYFTKTPMEFFPELVVHHIPPYSGTFKESLKKAFRYGVGKGALVGKWLINERQWIVLFEFLEMLVIPFIQVIRALLTFQFKLIPINGAAFVGRIYGLIKFLFLSKKKSQKFGLRN